MIVMIGLQSDIEVFRLLDHAIHFEVRWAADSAQIDVSVIQK